MGVRPTGSRDRPKAKDGSGGSSGVSDSFIADDVRRLVA